MGALYKLAGALPAPVTRTAGRAASRHGWLRPLVARAKPVGPVTIGRGEAAGMRIWADERSNLGYALGTTEPDVQAALAKHLKPGGVCYDVGANVGFHVLIAAKVVGPHGRVYAFEPLPENISALKRNIDLNGLSNVEVIEAAVSDRDGSAQLEIGTSSVDPRLIEHRQCPSTDQIAVRVMRLDNAGLKPPNLVKIDAEGAEFAVVAGMRRLLAEYRPVVLCELHSFDGRSVAEFETALGTNAPFYEIAPVERHIRADAWAPHILAVPRARA